MNINIETAPNTRPGHKEPFYVRLEVNGEVIAKSYAPTQEMATRMALAILGKAYEAGILKEPEPAPVASEKAEDPEPQEENLNSIEDVLDALTGLDKWIEENGEEGKE